MILGSAITSSTLAADPRYQTAEATPALLSNYAFEQRSASDFEVVKVINGMKDEYGNGASTLVRIFNATGERLFYQSDFHVRGNSWKYPFDAIIENGQWSLVLIVHTGKFEGVAGGVVYRTESGPVDVFCGWDVPYFDGSFSGHKNTVHCEIQVPDYWAPKESAKRAAVHEKTRTSGPSGRTGTPVAGVPPHEYKVSIVTAGGTSPMTDIVFGRVTTLK